MPLNKRQLRTLESVAIEVRASNHPTRWKSRTIQALNTAMAGDDPPDLTHYVRAAQRDKHVDGELEIDDHAVVSMCEEGAYVEAWVWIPKEAAGGR